MRLLLAILLIPAACLAGLPASGTLYLNADEVRYVDSPVEVSGELNIIGPDGITDPYKLPLIVNRRAVKDSPAVVYRQGERGVIRNVRIKLLGWPIYNRWLDYYDADLRQENVWIDNGWGVFGVGGKFVWKGGGAVGSTYKYAYYGGNRDNGGPSAGLVHLENLRFDGARSEANVRLEGCEQFIARGCRFLNLTDFARPPPSRHGKGGIALRLVSRAILENCEIHFTELGWRIPESVGNSDEAWGKTHPSYIALIDCRVRGMISANGNTLVGIRGGKSEGLDPRGVGGNIALAEQTHKSFRGEIAIDGYSVPAGMVVGSGVSFDRSRVNWIIQQAGGSGVDEAQLAALKLEIEKQAAAVKRIRDELIIAEQLLMQLQAQARQLTTP